MTRLLVVNCSQKKQDVPSAPALELYRGPVHAIIRKAVQSGVEPTITYIISGKYGLIRGDQVIQNYDHKADPETDDHLPAEVASRLEVLSHQEWSDVYFGVMASYGWILPTEATLREWFPGCTIRPSMPLGHGYHHLQEWLYGRAMTRDVSTLNRLVILGQPSMKKKGKIMDVANDALWKVMREYAQAGNPIPVVRIATSRGWVSPGAMGGPTAPLTHSAAVAMAPILSRMNESIGPFDEVFIQDTKLSKDYLPDPAAVFPGAKISRPSERIPQELGMWLRGEALPPPISGGKGKSAKSNVPVWAQPLPEGCTEPFKLIVAWRQVDANTMMRQAYEAGYRLQSFHIQIHHEHNEGTEYTIVMAMPQACLF